MAASGSSSRSGASSRRRRHPGKPIPYRQPPFSYGPAVLCECGEMMPQWISWSDPNPGRRYINCKIRSISYPLLNCRLPPSEFHFYCGWFIFHISQIDGGIGCASFEWVDEPMDKYLKDLVRDLRDAVWDRDEEIERLQEEISLLAGRKQSNDEPKNQAFKMQADGGSNLFMFWVLSVAFAIYCTWVMCSNWNMRVDKADCCVICSSVASVIPCSMWCALWTSVASVIVVYLLSILQHLVSILYRILAACSHYFRWIIVAAYWLQFKCNLAVPTQNSRVHKYTLYFTQK